MFSWLGRFACWMGWHDGKLRSRACRKGFDGCSVHARCSRCRKEVMQDSQGNWF